MTSERNILEDILKNQKQINAQIHSAEQELAALDEKRKELQARIEQLNWQKQSTADGQLSFDRLSESNVTNDSTQEQKIALFRSLFRGREDVYPRRFESKRTGKSGYQPVCRNEWIRPYCQKPKIKCGNCENRDFMPLSDGVIRNDLLGIDPTDRYRREFVIGVYPMLVDETCWFLAVDFDKETWKENSAAYLKTCEKFNLPAALKDQDQEMAVTSGSFFPNRYRQSSLVNWEFSCSPRQWKIDLRWDSDPTIDFFPVRIPCQEVTSET